MFLELFILRNREVDFQGYYKWQINECKEESLLWCRKYIIFDWFSLSAGLYVVICWYCLSDVSLKKILPLGFARFNVILGINYAFSDMSYIFINMKRIPKKPFKISLKLKLDHYVVDFIAYVLSGSSNKNWNKTMCGYMVGKR